MTINDEYFRETNTEINIESLKKIKIKKWQYFRCFPNTSINIGKIFQLWKVDSGVLEGPSADLLEETERHITRLSHPQFEIFIL